MPTPMRAIAPTPPTTPPTIAPTGVELLLELGSLVLVGVSLLPELEEGAPDALLLPLGRDLVADGLVVGVEVTVYLV